MSTHAPAAPDPENASATSRTETAAMAEALCQRLSAVSGLDAALGIKHLRSRSDSYIRLLRKFAETRAVDVEAMSERIASQDYPGLSSLVHNVQGVAGFLGAIEIEALASDVCAAVRTGRDALEIDRLATALIKAQSELGTSVLALVAVSPIADR